ncbi:hypothetical protein PT250_05330 [Erysipelothrix rhusiopathiae]|nr:hypothetical protein [Erysipelothrix rhusiopathiae]MDE8340104.1 hypothetical protein [Erysipelothrix rhusiopathiae]MDE8341526.1 hypothetical protein [Erysipelothrix rhusiopathiae]RNM31944.1 hypothetical protein EF876_01455 [Erysipelothrix rhusiopathiae]URQ76866.1 hypothetical protein NBX27_06320 [Erysipelothrix rhusiopathiae]VEH83505.1 Uncharacterised protein [Erysipelothrix rhusiopathiae]
MKKIYGIILVMLSLVLVGCGTNSQGSGQKAIDAFFAGKTYTAYISSMESSSELDTYLNPLDYAYGNMDDLNGRVYYKENTDGDLVVGTVTILNGQNLRTEKIHILSHRKNPDGVFVTENIKKSNEIALKKLTEKPPFSTSYEFLELKNGKRVLLQYDEDTNYVDSIYMFDELMDHLLNISLSKSDFEDVIDLTKTRGGIIRSLDRDALKELLQDENNPFWDVLNKNIKASRDSFTSSDQSETNSNGIQRYFVADNGKTVEGWKEFLGGFDVKNID